MWERFQGIIPENEQGDLIKAYNKRLFSGDAAEEMAFAKAWARWENALASVRSNGQGGVADGAYARAFSRLENHYFTHGAFLEREGQILEDIDKISHIPGVIVQGRFDMICPPSASYALSKSGKRPICG